MHPVVGQRATKSAFSLRDFVFVMRKLQIRAAAMDIERQSQEGFTHGRALNMPARTSPAIRRIPARVGWFVLLGGFPQDKIKWISLGGSDSHTFACAQVIEGFA